MKLSKNQEIEIMRLLSEPVRSYVAVRKILFNESTVLDYRKIADILVEHYPVITILGDN